MPAVRLLGRECFLRTDTDHGLKAGGRTAQLVASASDVTPDLGVQVGAGVHVAATGATSSTMSLRITFSHQSHMHERDS